MKTKSIISFFTPLFVFLFVITVTITCRAAEAEAPEDIAAKLQLRYDNMTSLTFNFNQDTRGELTGRPRKGSGTATFLKSDSTSRMRWDYLSPKKQVILNDGKQFYMYFEDLQQMIISPSENLDNDLTYSFFSGKGNLKKDFYIRPADPDLESDPKLGFKVVKLIPIVPHSQVQDIHLWVSADSLIRRIHIQDHFGTITVLNLSEIYPDSLKDKPQAEIESLFSFSPPENTEIIQQ